eukprot:TRINITY_DN5901_c1_g2_i4.p1 TRINITY_DN5901_c1_g2~~TRINITY_DN5901_c1_g2_i4.p1  ORF type:complete len:181 (-),score=37.79 TRINITY_DN5901_c1_g2_i4:3-545(-)
MVVNLLAVCYAILIFWVFYSESLFKENVMVSVATKQSQNPVDVVAAVLTNHTIPVAHTIDLPGKIVFPQQHHPSRFYMLGLGDIVLPGLFLAFIHRVDKHPRVIVSRSLSYFTLAMACYILSLGCAIVAVSTFGVAQPALLYIVPLILIPVLVVAARRHEFKLLWEGLPRPPPTDIEQAE